MPPKTYYQILQVDSEASPEVLEAAYRRLARMNHPDVNSAPDALTRMQELNQAYDVLKIPETRRAYDAKLANASASGSMAEAYYGRSQQRTSASTQPPRAAQTNTASASRASTNNIHNLWDDYAEPNVPFRCKKCGCSEASLRLAAFPSVVSLLIVTMRGGNSGLYCHRCRVGEMTDAKVKTAFLGWWGIPFGPIYTLGALFTPSDGKVPADANGPYLGALGLHFLKVGQIGKGIEALEASLGYQYSREVSDLLLAAKQYQFGATEHSSPSAKPYESRQASGTRTASAGPSISNFPIKWAIVGVLILLMALGRCSLRPAPNAYGGGATTRAPAADSTHAPTVRPTPKPLWPAAIVLDDVNLRSGPSATYPSYREVTTGKELLVLAQQYDCAWLKVKSRAQDIGWIRNDGKKVKWEWNCAMVPLGVYASKTTALMRSRSSDAYGGLEIENGTSRDAVAILTNASDQTLASAYIRAGDTYEITRIPNGSFQLYFTSGSGWNGAQFTSGAVYSEFDDPILFTTTARGSSVWSVTLQPVEGGTATTSTIGEGSFPAIE